MIVLIALILSFVGSIPLGVITMSVADAAMHRGMKSALLVGLGAVLVEFVQSFVAVKFAHLLVDNMELTRQFQVIAMMVFFSLSIYYLFIAKVSATNPQAAKKDRPDFAIGAGISLLNVMVFPYWIFYGTYLSTEGWLEIDNLQVGLFSLGVSIGSFMAFVLYAKLALYIVERSNSIVNYTNKFIGLVLLGFGVWQAWNYFN